MSKKLMVPGIVAFLLMTMTMGPWVPQVYAVARSIGAAVHLGERPVANARVVIKRKAPTGQVTEKEDRTDREGGFVLFPGGDENANPIDSIEVYHEGKKYTFAGPFSQENLENALDLNLLNASNVVTAGALGQPSVQGSGVSVTGNGSGWNVGQMVQFSVTYGYMFGSAETSVKENGVKHTGDNIDISQSTIRPDIRVFLGPLGNFGSIGSLANIGNLGTIGLSNCYGGIQGAIGLTGGNVGLNTNLHGMDNLVDTTLKQKFQGAITPYVGCKVVEFAPQFGYLNLQAGPRISWYEYTFMTDERQGGGNFQQVTQHETKVGASFGLEYNNFFDYGSIGNLGGYGHGIQGGLQIGIWGEYLPGTQIVTMTQPFNLNYAASTEGTWVGTVRAGWSLKF